MKLLLPILLGLTTLTTADLVSSRSRFPKLLTPCGFKTAPCPSGTVCKPNDPSCPAIRGENCAGLCTPPPTYAPCGFKIAPCPSGTICKPNDPSCPAIRGENCAGQCMPLPPAPTYASCGGFRVQVSCPKGQICVDDPRSGGCGMACDAPGICVTPEFCGGIAAFKCKDGRKMCVDDPRDDCDPLNGGADCGGLCV